MGGGVRTSNIRSYVNESDDILKQKSKTSSDIAHQYKSICTKFYDNLSDIIGNISDYNLNQRQLSVYFDSQDYYGDVDFKKFNSKKNNRLKCYLCVSYLLEENDNINIIQPSLDKIFNLCVDYIERLPNAEINYNQINKRTRLNRVVEQKEIEYTVPIELIK